MGWRQGIDLEALARELHDIELAKAGSLSSQQKIQLEQLYCSLNATKDALTEVSLAFWRAINKQKKDVEQLWFAAAGALLFYIVLDFLGWWPQFDLIRAVALIIMISTALGFWIRDELKIYLMQHTKRLLERDWSALNQSSNLAGAAIEWRKDDESVGEDWPEVHRLRWVIISLSARLALIDLISDKKTQVTEQIWEGSQFYM